MGRGFHRHGRGGGRGGGGYQTRPNNNFNGNNDNNFNNNNNNNNYNYNRNNQNSNNIHQNFSNNHPSHNRRNNQNNNNNHHFGFQNDNHYGQDTMMYGTNDPRNSNQTNTASQAWRGDRDREKLLLTLLEQYGQDFHSLNALLQGQKERSELGLARGPDFLGTSARLSNPGCSSCRTLASKVNSLQKQIQGILKFRTPQGSDKLTFSQPSPASPLESPYTIFSPAGADDSMESPIDSFLTSTATFLKSKNAVNLFNLYRINFSDLPSNVAPAYVQLHLELNQRYPLGKEERLLSHCKKVISHEAKGIDWEKWNSFVCEYLVLLRDFQASSTEERIMREANVTSCAVLAMGDATYGFLISRIVLSLCRRLARAAILVNKNPSGFISGSAHLMQKPADFVEESANTLRDAFVKSLSDQSATSSKTSKPSPDDKRSGIYVAANACLRVLFQTRKLRNAQQIFLSIDAQSPPLAFYAAAQRVTYLYYLGRYHFANSHLYRASFCLQSAYSQCHREATEHRRSILTYLIACNIPLGRFPSSKLLMRTEAAPIAKRFLQLCNIIRRGDLGAFYQYFDLGRETAQWLLKKRVLLQLKNRCEILVWRSLIRKVFVLVGFHGEEKKVPFVKLNAVRAAAKWSLERAKSENESKGNDEGVKDVSLHTSFGFSSAPQTGTPQFNGQQNTPVFSFGASLQPQSNSIFTFGSQQPPQSPSTVARPTFALGNPSSAGTSSPSTSRPTSSSDSQPSASPSSTYTDPDFLGVSSAIADTGFDPGTGLYLERQFGDDEGNPNPHESAAPLDEDHQPPTMQEIESITHSLIAQKLLRGFATHANPRFAVPGASVGGWKAKAFPPVWEVIKEKSGGDHVQVPGWVKELDDHPPGAAVPGAGSMGGRVVRLSGARPVGQG